MDADVLLDVPVRPLYSQTTGKELSVLSEGATRWTDNVFAVKKQCVRKYNMTSKVRPRQSVFVVGWLGGWVGWLVGGR